MNIQLIFLIISVLSPLLPLWVGREDRTSLLWLYVATGLFFDLLLNTCKSIPGFNYLWIGNLYALIEFLFISFIYKKILFNNSVAFFSIVTTFITCFIIINIRYTIWKFNTVGASIFYLIYMFYSITGFYKLLTEQKFLFLEKSRLFWLHCAFLIYGSGNFLLFLFTDYLIMANNSLFRILWSTFFLIINTTLNILIAVALSKKNIPENEFR